MRIPAFVGGSYRGQSLAAGLERSVNWYPHRTRSPGAKARLLLYPTPGFERVTDIPTVHNRGVFGHGPSLWLVASNVLYEVDRSMALLPGPAGGYGSVEPEAGQQLRATPDVRFAASGPPNHEMMLVSDGRAWLMRLRNASPDPTIARAAHSLLIANPGAAGQKCVPPGSTADDVAFLDGFFLVLDATTSTLRASDLTDGSKWSGLRVAQRLQTADPWIAMRVTPRGQVWLFGEQTSDVYWNTGGTPMPFVPMSGGQINSGTPARRSPTVVDSHICWLAQNATGAPAVIAADASFRLVEISTPEVAAAISRYTLSDAVGIGYRQSGHTFYCLTFPSDRRTWVYDFTTDLWHERVSIVAGREQAWAPEFFARFAGRDLVGTNIDGGLYGLSERIFAEQDEPMRRIRQTPHLADQRHRIIVHEVEVDFERGTGELGRTDSIQLEFSNNGGRTWRAVDPQPGNIGGEYRVRLRWYRLGSGRDIGLRLITHGTVPWRLIDGFAEIEVLQH